MAYLKIRRLLSLQYLVLRSPGEVDEGESPSMPPEECVDGCVDIPPGMQRELEGLGHSFEPAPSV